MKSYQIKLPDEVAAFVDRVLAGGTWDSFDQLVAYALLQVESELTLDDNPDIDELRKRVGVGIEEADRGELIDGPVVLQQLRDKLVAAKRRST
jgi:hypothetical protein